MSDQNSQEGYIFKTVFGLLEEDFMRTASKGNYTPVIHEFEELALHKKVTFNEYRLLVFIKSKTVNFRNTHIRMTRKQVYEALELPKPKFYDAIHSLISNGYLLEKKDENDYYFYALNPITFGGVIVMRSASEARNRINRAEKIRKGTLSVPLKGTKKDTKWYQEGTLKVTKWYPEEASIIRNYSGFEMLKYTLLKYILLNGISAVKSQECIKLLEETKNPEFMMKQFVALIQKQPMSSRGIVEEFLRAHREGTDGNGKPIQKNAAAYIITQWDSVKHYWQNLHHSMDMSTDAIDMRKAIADLIAEYPIESNVVQLKVSYK